MLTAPTTGDLTLTVKDEILVRASLEHTFESVLAQMQRLAFGFIEDGHRQGVAAGWAPMLQRIVAAAERA